MLNLIENLGLYFVCVFHISSNWFLGIFYKNIVSSGLGGKSQSQFFIADSLRCTAIGEFRQDRSGRYHYYYSV